MGIVFSLVGKVKRYLTSGKQRSVKAKKNILASFGIKLGSILTGFILVPLTIDYVDKTQYGIWLTLSSVVAWFSFFDIGLGHGLRNKFAEAVANKDHHAARVYVSSTYFILGIISFSLVIIFWLINPLINWNTILKSPSDSANLNIVVLIVFSFFCISFVLKLIQIILKADQKPAMGNLLNLLTNLLSLGIIWGLTQATAGSLLYLSIALSISPVIVFSIANLYFFRSDYRIYVPHIRYVEKASFQSLMSLGGQFFVIQIIGIIIFSTDNMIITQIFSPEEVTPYNIAFKYFGIISQGFAIVSTPFWSAYTEAYQANDHQWIRRSNQKLTRVWVIMCLVGILMLIISDLFYHLWVPTVEVPFILSACMFLFVIIKAWGGIFVMFINGVGKVRLQLLTSIIGGILNIPLSIFFAKSLNMGTAGVILASTICLFYGPVLAPIQFQKIMNRSAKGIWNK